MGVRVRRGGMTTPIDCSRMSHTTCYAAESLDPAASGSTASPAASSQAKPGPDVSAAPDGASYDCVNDCVSSLGVTALLSSATTALGCVLVPPACPIFIGAGVGTILGACEVACEDLQAKP